MWPKAFAQLIELAPHISRLLPMADRFLQTKTVSDDGSRKALEAVAEGWRGDLRQVAVAHAGLHAQTTELNDKVSLLNDKVSIVATAVTGIAADMTGAAANAQAARLAAESSVDIVERRLAQVEARQARLSTLLGIALLLLVVLCIVSAISLTRAH